MSSLLESLGKVKIGVWQFWRIVTNQNRDLPFYDYDEETWTYVAPNGQG